MSNDGAVCTGPACPFCGHQCTADFVDIGVGMQRCGPYGCDNCHAVEIGPEQFAPGWKCPADARGGFYAPPAPPEGAAHE